MPVIFASHSVGDCNLPIILIKDVFSQFLTYSTFLGFIWSVIIGIITGTLLFKIGSYFELFLETYVLWNCVVVSSK